MKKILMVLLCLLSLTACGTTPPPAQEAELGRYLCQALTLEDLPLEVSGVWVELREGGVLTVYLNGEERSGRWTLEGDAFALKLDDGTKGTGTLSNGVLVLDMGSVDGSFAKEGTAPVETETPSTTTTFSCGGLYYVDYDTQVFQPDPTRLADLQGVSGTSNGWITKLDSAELVAQWQQSFEARRTDGVSLHYETRELTVAGYHTRAIVYQDQQGYHSEIIVDFGEDKGTRQQPMWAAYLCFLGAARKDVWNDAVQALLFSLCLG